MRMQLQLEDGNGEGMIPLLQDYLLGNYESMWQRLSPPEEHPEDLALLAKTALAALNIPLATKVYRMMGDLDMQMYLESLALVEDKNLFCGHICVALSEFNLAQEFFLSSPKPSQALTLRCDLLQWELSLQLAGRLAPEEVPSISAQYAQHLESHGNNHTIHNTQYTMHSYRKSV